MILVFYNFMMAVTFCLLVGFTAPYFVLGYLLGLVILSLMPQLPSARAFLFPDIPSGRRLIRFSLSLVVFVWDFIRDLTISNFQIAWDVLTPTDHFHPILVEVPIDDLSDFEIMLLANRITLTPGTLSVDVSADRARLVVHVMYPGKENVVAQLRRPIDILRGRRP